jgi:GT2 family glycosyltransferase
VTSTAVITVAHGRHDHLLSQRRALAACEPGPADHVVVAIDDEDIASLVSDGSPPARVLAQDREAGRLPLARARNRGAQQALDLGHDILVFLDVDCLPDAALLAAYEAAIRENPEALLCGPVAYLPPAPDGGYTAEDLAQAQPHPARPAPPAGEVVLDPTGHDLFWSLSFAVTAATWSMIGGFDEAYVGYGAEDTDFGRRAAARDVPIGWVGGALAFHQHHPVSHPPVEHLDDVLRNGRLFRERWDSWPMQGWLDAFEADGLVERTPAGDYRRAS